jgi:hypothetical protein
MGDLPSIPALIRRTKALAALDLIMSPEWEFRYFSFNCKWADDEQMASMRDGSGDDWFMVFHKDGWGGLKGLTHESHAWSEGGGELSAALQSVIPSALGTFATEPAFSWHQTSFAYFHETSAKKWTRANDLTPFAGLDPAEGDVISVFDVGPDAYVTFAKDYYEVEIPLKTVTKIYELAPITRDIVKSLNPAVSLKDIEAELREGIGYPR